jgi:hypothetical protein
LSQLRLTNKSTYTTLESDLVSNYSTTDFYTETPEVFHNRNAQSQFASVPSSPSPAPPAGLLLTNLHTLAVPLVSTIVKAGRLVLILSSAVQPTPSPLALPAPFPALPTPTASLSKALLFPAQTQ